MNKTQKTIWSVYLLVVVILYFDQAIFSVKPRIISPEEIKLIVAGKSGFVNPTIPQYLWHKFLYLGWIPALMLHFIWRDRKKRGEIKK